MFLRVGQGEFQRFVRLCLNGNMGTMLNYVTSLTRILKKEITLARSNNNFTDESVYKISIQSDIHSYFEI